MTKNIYTIFALLWVVSGLHAQQEPMNTQFYLNKMAWNPAAAGTAETKQLTGMFRKQWVGFEGAPSLQTLSYDQEMFQQKVGFGANLSHFSMGITSVVSADLIYNYKLPMLQGALRIGLAPNIRHFYQNWASDKVVTDAPRNADKALESNATSRILANVGGGFYFNNEKFYVGAAVKKIFPNKIGKLVRGDTTSREVQHFNFMGGMSFWLNEENNVVLTPNILVKYAVNAPFNIDFNTALKIQNKYHAGLTYRTGGGSNSGIGESLDLMLGLQCSEKLLVSLSYDIGLSTLRKLNYGSVELMARYQFEPPADAGGQVSDPNNPFVTAINKNKDKAKSERKAAKAKKKEERRLEKEKKRSEKEAAKQKDKTASE